MTAQPLTVAAMKAAKSNQWVAYFAGGLLVALGVFMLVMDVIYPSAPGHSATPVALGFMAAGVVFTLCMRPLLRKRARDAHAQVTSPVVSILYEIATPRDLAAS